MNNHVMNCISLNITLILSVTLDWWDDLWLNEGFASYIEYKGVANYEKDWDMVSDSRCGGKYL